LKQIEAKYVAKDSSQSERIKNMLDNIKLVSNKNKFNFHQAKFLQWIHHKFSPNLQLISLSENPQN